MKAFLREPSLETLKDPRQSLNCLRRLAWRVVSPNRWIDDQGNEVNLSTSSPALVGHFLKLAVQRYHERRLARYLELQDYQRACLDPVAKLLRSKKFDARSKYFISALATGAYIDRRPGADQGVHQRWDVPSVRAA